MFVEKPIVVSLKEANIINDKIVDNNFFIVELMMYKYTLLYEEFINYWLINQKGIIKLIPGRNVLLYFPIRSTKRTLAWGTL